MINTELRKEYRDRQERRGGIREFRYNNKYEKIITEQLFRYLKKKKGEREKTDSKAQVQL